MNLKNYLPFENYTLTTKLSKEAVCKRIADSIEHKKPFRVALLRGNTTKPYEGTVFEDGFEISRVISYRNSFLPVIKGHISSYLGQTQIKVTMRPPIAVIIFMCVWLGIVGLVCLGILAAAILFFGSILRHGFSPMVLIPFVMFAFGYGLITIGFKTESKNSKEFLALLLQGEEINN